MEEALVGVGEKRLAGWAAANQGLTLLGRWARLGVEIGPPASMPGGWLCLGTRRPSL